LDRRNVDRITAYLFHAGGNDDPARLESNADLSFQGYILLGMGFTFDDTDQSGTASPLSEMQRLVRSDPRNGERILPYLGGEEVNNNPTHAFHRYAITFEDYPLQRKSTGHSWSRLTDETQRTQLREGIVAPDYPGPVAADWPDLLALVRERVKPERDTQKRDANRERWWQYAEKRPGLTRAVKKLKRVLAVNCGATPHMAFTFLDSKMIYANTLAIIASEDYKTFCILQSRVDEVWVRFFSSSMKDDLRYTPTDCFETFPLPPLSSLSEKVLDSLGESYFDCRSQILQQKDVGLTSLYNDFNDPECDVPEIARLRELHDEMDRAVLDAYGWSRLVPKCEFFPIFDDEELEEENGHPKKRKYRYRWPDDVRDDVLALLLDLNHQRALEEGHPILNEGTTASALGAKVQKEIKKQHKPRKDTQDSEGLFAVGPEEP
jgi:hypothetical protein